MSSRSAPFLIAAGRGLLDAGERAVYVAGAAAAAGWSIALEWTRAPWIGMLLAAVSTVTAAISLWLLVRIVIDKKLFAALEQNELGADTLAALDDALSALGWIDGSKTGRTLDARVRGVARLCKKATLLAAFQVLLIGGAFAASGFVPFLRP